MIATSSVFCVTAVEAANLPDEMPEYITTVKPVFSQREIDTRGGISNSLANFKLSVAKFNEASRNCNLSIEVQSTSYAITETPPVSPTFNNGVDFRQWLRLQPIWEEYNDEGSDTMAYVDTNRSAWAFNNGNLMAVSGPLPNIFRHEMGHNLGLYHHNATRQVVDGENYYTIMRGNGIPYFSGIDITYNGVVLGDGDGDSVPIILANRERTSSRRQLNLNKVTSSKLLYNKKSGLVATYEPNDDGSVVLLQRPYDGTSSQKLKVWKASEDLSFINVSGRFLSFPDFDYFTKPTLVSRRYQGTTRYVFEEQSDGYFSIKPNGTNKCLSTLNSSRSGKPIQLYIWRGETSQRWNVVHVSTNE